jgi:hypothetical protein
MAKNSKNFTISINHHICPIFHAENNLSTLKFNFAHFIGPILTLRGPALLCSSCLIYASYGYQEEVKNVQLLMQDRC